MLNLIVIHQNQFSCIWQKHPSPQDLGFDNISLCHNFVKLWQGSKSAQHGAVVNWQVVDNQWQLGMTSIMELDGAAFQAEVRI